MYRALWLALAVGLLMSVTAPVEVRADWLERNWTNTEGKTITARFIRATPTMALLNKDGKVLRVRLDELSQFDREWIPAAEELKKMRQWVLIDGSSHRARLQEIEGDILTLEERSETITLTIAQLNADDQSLVATVSAVAPSRGFSSPSAPAATTSRKWTDKRGKTIDAEFRGVEGDKVVLFFRNKEHRVPISDLSDEDREFVESQQGGIAIAEGGSTPPRSPDEMSQQERIDELLRKRRERAERLAQNPPPTPPVHEEPTQPAPSYEPSIHAPRHENAASEDFGPPAWAGGHRPRATRGWDDDEGPRYHSQPVYQKVIICQGCRYENPASSFKAGDKCRGCGERIDIIQNADGSTHSRSASYSGRKIGRIVAGVATLIGLLFGAMKKMMG